MSLAIIQFMEPQATRYSNWHDTALPGLTQEQKYWLRRPGALTAGLRQIGRVRLTVVKEYSSGLSPQEAWMLGCIPQSPIRIREIKMSVNGVDSVVARSFAPLAASHSWWRGMRHLRSRPLADMLYHNAQITRSQFFICRLRRQQPIYQTVRRATGARAPMAQTLLARCSVFRRQGQPLLVAECFLPGFWPLAAKSRYDRNLVPDSGPLSMTLPGMPLHDGFHD